MRKIILAFIMVSVLPLSLLPALAADVSPAASDAKSTAPDAKSAGPDAKSAPEPKSATTAFDATMEKLESDYDSPSNDTRLNAHMTVSNLVVGDLPTRLENRLGDHTEQDLATKATEIIDSHRQLVTDLQTFANASSDAKDQRKATLEALKKHTSVLSPKDQDAIKIQLDELSWTSDSIKTRLASAIVMLAFNYYYFHGLTDRELIVKSLKEAMNASPSVTKDNVFLDVAKKGLAQNDPEFMSQFAKAAGAQFDPASIP